MKVLIYDDTFEGFLTAIFDAYSIEEPFNIIKKSLFYPDLVSIPFEIVTSKEKFDRVLKGIKKKFDLYTLNNIYRVFLSEVNGSEDLVFKYIKLCFLKGIKINLAKNNEIIMQIDKISNKVSIEAHRFYGFLRFKEIAELTFYAAIEPDHNILPLIVDHFVEKFSNQRFIIHDIKRENAMIFNLKEVVFSEMSLELGKKIENSSNDEKFESLWRSFYTSVNIEERKNEKLRKQFMPKRYWNHLTEMI